MKTDGGPAFPQTTETTQATSQGILPSQGMSLRDYFAAMALQGHCAKTHIFECAMNEKECALAFTNAAAFSYRCADAMLAKRDK